MMMIMIVDSAYKNTLQTRTNCSYDNQCSYYNGCSHKSNVLLIQ